MDAFWQWMWDRFGSRYSLALGTILFPLPLSIFNSVSLYMIDPVSHEYVFNTGGNSVLGRRGEPG